MTPARQKHLPIGLALLAVGFAACGVDGDNAPPARTGAATITAKNR